MIIKLLYIMIFVAVNILSYNVGYLQGLSDFYYELRENIHLEPSDDHMVPRKGPAAKALHT